MTWVPGNYFPGTFFCAGGMDARVVVACLAKGNTRQRQWGWRNERQLLNWLVVGRDHLAKKITHNGIYLHNLYNTSTRHLHSLGILAFEMVGPQSLAD